MQLTPNAATLALTILGIGHFPDVAIAQGVHPEAHATVYTLADSIMGGAAGLSVDRMGMVYAGTFDDRVYRIRMNGRSEIFARGLYGATGNVVGPKGNLYQLNFFGGYVTTIDRRGNQEMLAAGLETPMDVTLTESDLYVANCGSNAITRVTLNGEVTTLAQGAPFNCPNGITYASDGNLYVVNFSDTKLLRVGLDGEVTQWLTLPYSQNVIASARGYLYVASGSARQVQRVSLRTGEITHIAGSGRRGRQDGSALDATFDWPNGIAATGAGKIFIHDLNAPVRSDNGTVELGMGRIRVVSLPSLTEELIAIYDSAGADAMVAAYHAYRADEATAGFLDEAEVNGWGHATLPVLPEAAIRIFKLNAESYPDSWRVYDALGDAYTKIGQTAEAIAAFERSLTINPDNPTIVRKVRQLRGKSSQS